MKAAVLRVIEFFRTLPRWQLIAIVLFIIYAIYSTATSVVHG